MKRPCPHGRGGANDRTSRPLALFMSPRGQGGGGSPKRRRTRKQPLLPFAPAAEENLVRHGAALQPLSHLLRISLLLCAPAPSSARGRLPRPRKPPPFIRAGAHVWAPAPLPRLALPRHATPSLAKPSRATPCHATPSQATPQPAPRIMPGFARPVHHERPRSFVTAHPCAPFFRRSGVFAGAGGFSPRITCSLSLFVRSYASVFILPLACGFFQLLIADFCV